ncbi:MAG: methyltransferase, partial [Armatimonadetes bacterium]|nr:methyltransferase [Armatimonadota bacterium]
MKDDKETTELDTDHYFTAQPAARSQPKQFTISVREVMLTLTSDRGVFSHGQLDDGTLRLLKKMELPETGDFLDLGCGYGVIGLMAAKLRPEAHVTMVDINERATKLAADNARANGISNVE